MSLEAYLFFGDFYTDLGNVNYVFGKNIQKKGKDFHLNSNFKFPAYLQKSFFKIYTPINLLDTISELDKTQNAACDDQGRCVEEHGGRDHEGRRHEVREESVV